MSAIFLSKSSRVAPTPKETAFVDPPKGGTTSETEIAAGIIVKVNTCWETSVGSHAWFCAKIPPFEIGFALGPSQSLTPIVDGVKCPVVYAHHHFVQEVIFSQLTDHIPGTFHGHQWLIEWAPRMEVLLALDTIQCQNATIWSNDCLDTYRLREFWLKIPELIQRLS